MADSIEYPRTAFDRGYNRAYNSSRIAREMRAEGSPMTTGRALSISNDLRDELGRVGIKGFKRGGRVHRTGIYKLHRGERVMPARRGRRR